MIGITSIQNQSVHIFIMNESGKLINIHDVGNYLQSNDRLELTTVQNKERNYQKSIITPQYVACDCPILNLIGNPLLQEFIVPDNNPREDFEFPNPAEDNMLKLKKAQRPVIFLLSKINTRC